ncbi:MAG: hypothetical protein LBM95_07105 [Lactobacillales bacterium]|nr:hypothetical protein [Lactobacillales bacterium]
MTIIYKKKNYTTIVEASGRISHLSTSERNSTWVNDFSESFGLPFVNGTQNEEVYLSGNFEKTSDEQGFFSSESKQTQIQYDFKEESIHYSATLPLNVGPRSGIDFSFNLLDSNVLTTDHCMPKILYTDEKQQYAYFVFHSTTGEYLALTVKTPFAAWRIKYSKAGHRMLGFQLLNQIDDLVDNPLTIRTRKLEGSFLFSDTLEDIYEKIAEYLEISIAYYEINGGVIGNTIPLKIAGETTKMEVISPDGGKKELSYLEVLLEKKGTYQIQSYAKNGKQHVSSLLAVGEWKDYFVSMTEFSMDYFQHEVGAFYRAIHTDTLSPDGITFEGVSFGNPFKMVSCRTGEFGGFAGWGILKRALLFGKNEKIANSLKRYYENWALNLGHEKEPFLGQYQQKNKCLKVVNTVRIIYNQKWEIG